MKSKRLLLMLLIAILAPWAANAQTVTIGTGTSAHNSAPIANYYNYSLAEMLFTSAEIGSTDVNTILSIGFEGAAASSKTYVITVYMKNVDATSFSAASDYIQVSASDVVYTGSIKPASGWNTIELATPFTYDNTKSLLVVVNKTSGGYDSNTSIWKYTSMSSPYMMLYGQNDSNPGVYNPTTLTSLATSSERPNVQLTFGTPPTCFAPQNLTCTEYTATSATLTWQRHASGTETAWVLQYSTDNTFATGVQSVNVSTTPSTQLTGLTAETTYFARVRPDCDENLWSDVCEFKPTNAQIVSIGSGTGTNGNLPTNPFYNYSYTQQIYTAAEIDMVGSIKNISFKGNKDGTRSLTIYMVNTTKETFSSKTDVIPIADATQVFSGSVIFTANEWKTIELAGNGFDYEGDNLAIIVYDNTQNYAMGQTNWATFTTTGNQAVYFYQDGSITPTAPSASSNAVTTSKNQIKLSILPSNTPKPRNLEVVEGTLSSSGVTLQWQAPASGTPTGYEYQYKEASVTDWPATWTSNGTDLSKSFSDLTASTPYDFRVRATYAEGNSKPVETQFTTLDNCAFPTGFAATLTPGVGTMATFSWTKGFSEDDDWVLQYGTDNTFATCTEITDGFTVSGNTVTFEATTDITPEVLHYARVKTDCGSGSYSSWTDVYEFTPSNYVDYTFRETASSSYSYVPFYGSYTTSATNQSQFVIPASELVDLTGGTIRSITYYTSSTATTDWGGVEFDVYMTEVQDNTFSSATFIDWATLGSPVYSGTVSLSNQKMIITFDNNYAYNGGNLLIGFKNKKAGTSTTSMSWTAYYGSTYYAVYQYGTNSASRSYYQPKITFNYQPTPYKKPVIDEASCTFETTSAHIAWTVTGATPTGYQYQYKPASATEWPSAWTSVTTTYADLSGLTPGSFYDFRVKALYDGGNESVVVDYSFVTECAAITAFPWSEKFETYSAGDFSHPCWQNVHISGNGAYIFKVYTSTNGSNTTHQLQLPDQSDGTLTKLRLPEMNLPSNDYQFVIDVYRSTAYEDKTGEGVRVYASTNGEIEGATELVFIPRLYSVASGIIPAEATGNAWYTYELPIGMSGTCYIILRGENQFGTSTYMDNLTVEQISTCARPSELASSNVTNHSATIEWTAGDTEQTLWQIAYSKTNFDPNTANFDITTVSTIDATAHLFTLDKILDAASTYYVYVRANCGTDAEPDFGPWSRKGISFTTQVATPAPSNFVASNPASAKVDLVWNAGGGDTETWELYYVASSTDPEAPTASTTATVSNITTLPTTEAPYVLEGLDPVTKYYAWIRAKHVWDNETTYSDWVALTGDYFVTLDACPTPTNLVATNLTSVSADLSWVGSDDVTEGYTVEYGEEGTYSLNETEDFSAYTATTYSATGSLPEGWYGYSSGSYKPHVSNNSVLGGSYDLEGFAGGAGSTNNFLYMIGNSTSPNTSYTILPQFSDVMAISFDYGMESASYGTLTVGYCTDNTSGSTFVAFTDLTLANSKNSVSVNLTSADIALLNDNHGYLTFCWTYNGSYGIGIDNVTIKGGTYTPGATQTVPSEGTSITIDGLTPNKAYTVKVKSNCTNGEWSNMVSFTTLAEGNMVFTNATADGKWGTADNWAPAQLPVSTDEVILRANATIENGCVAEAKSISGTGTGSGAYTLTIEDGGKLKHLNSNVRATVKKHIATYTESGWHLITNPLTSAFTPTEANGFLSGTYRLYRWDYTQDLEWQYFDSHTDFTTLSSGVYSYLYANGDETDLIYTGTINAYTGNKSRNCNVASNPENYDFPSWYLLGNPYLYDAYLASSGTNGNALPYYRMSQAGDEIEPVDAGTPIGPMEGFFYQGVTGATTAYVVTYVPTVPDEGKLNMTVGQGRGTKDKAIIRFGEGYNLEKFSLNANSTKVYISQEGKDYAIVNAESQGEMPVNFKAEENGTYTLSFSSEEVSFSYLHLIDNMTGTDIDLLASPSYSFEARTTDYESRFKLVFCTGDNSTDDSFAFFSNGNWIINNDGEATLQVIDVNGRILSSETVSGSVSKAINATPGVYMIRLINGENVKVQKIVVR